jgi:hypothetical protein
MPRETTSLHKSAHQTIGDGQQTFRKALDCILYDEKYKGRQTNSRLYDPKGRLGIEDAT